ncbi:MAG: ADP-ribosylglycohydrolase family protein [Gemmatimonadales bacterium]
MSPPTAPSSSRETALLTALLRPFAPAAEPGEVALARAVASQIPSPELDLGALVEQWLRGREQLILTPGVRVALDHLANHGAPAPEQPGIAGLGAAVVCLPLVVRHGGSDRNLVSGAYHVARLVDSDPVAHWQAVGVSVATACFLRGQRDVVPEVLGAFRANDAPAGLADVTRRVPIWSRPEGEVAGDFEQLLWSLHHFREASRVTAGVADRGPIVLRLAEAMVAART